MDYTNNNDEISLAELFELVKKGFLWAVILGLLFGIIAFLMTRRQPKQYAASAQLLLTLPADQLNRYGDVALVTANAVDPSAYIAAVESAPIIQEALVSMGAMEASNEQLTDEQYGHILDFRERLSVESTVERLSSLITLKMTGGDSRYVSQEVNSLANALLNWDRQRAGRTLNQVIATLEQQIFGVEQQLELLERNFALENTVNTPPVAVNTNNQNDDSDENVSPEEALENLPTLADNPEYVALSNLKTERTNQLNSLKTLSQSAVGLLEVIELSHPSKSPVAPRVMFSTLIALILGGLLGYVAYFLRTSLSTNINTLDGLQKATGLPIVGEFSRIAASSRNLPQEQVRYLRTNLLLATQDISPKIILVTSGNAAQGKSTVALNLAESFALGDYKTLLVDADMRKPGLYKSYHYQMSGQSNGLAEHLKQQGTLHEPIKVQLSAKHMLDFIPSFEPTTTAPELLAHGIKPCLQQWRQQYDAIIIDSAPLLAVADSLIIAPHSNATLLVSSLASAKQDSVLNALELLQRIGVNVVGNVATSVPRDNQQNYQYGYGQEEK